MLMVEKVISELLQGKRKIVTLAKLNREREELSLRYVRFWHKVDGVDRSHDVSSRDLRITIDKFKLDIKIKRFKKATKIKKYFAILKVLAIIF